MIKNNNIIKNNIIIIKNKKTFITHSSNSIIDFFALITHPIAIKLRITKVE